MFCLRYSEVGEALAITVQQSVGSRRDTREAGRREGIALPNGSVRRVLRQNSAKPRYVKPRKGGACNQEHAVLRLRHKNNKP